MLSHYGELDTVCEGSEDAFVPAGPDVDTTVKTKRHC